MQKEYSSFTSFKTFLTKEVRRFLKVWGQTVLGPIITTSLYLGVFSLAIGDRVGAVSGVSYAEFLVPGLIMMTLIQNAFANTSSSIMIAKVNGNIVDTLMSPIVASSTVLAYAVGSIVRGLIVGALTLLYVMIFVKIHIHSVFWILFFAITSCLLLGLLGLIAGIISMKFDQLANFTNIVITPLSFLSGTFYSIYKLPVMLQHIIHYNPFFYMIDGFRYGFIGVADSNIMIGAVFMLGLNLVVFLIAYLMWKTGYRIKE
ncbi:MAG: ABC transporter permease [Alphaproteobacteria bacterium]|nr:ABC transporter permease [Alphaproteobacteria bacterium]